MSVVWPEWAVGEDLDVVWVRHDCDHVLPEITSILDEVGKVRLIFVEAKPMWLDLLNTEWNDDWLLRELDERADDHQDAVLYLEFWTAAA